MKEYVFVILILSSTISFLGWNNAQRNQKKAIEGWKESLEITKELKKQLDQCKK